MNATRPGIEIFTRSLRFSWILVAAITVMSEVGRVPVMTPFVHYGLYGPTKALIFLLLGFLTPLAFLSLNALNRGIVFAAVSTGVIELLQRRIGSGHSFHWYELALKISFILLGTIVALDARYHRSLTVGKFSIELICEKVFGNRLV
jgi:hypothetical protein